MKTMMLTATTRPVYRNQLAQQLMDAVTHNALSDSPPIQNREEAAKGTVVWGASRLCLFS